MPRIMGIDLGDVRTGIAISDPTGKMAFGVCTVTEYSEEKLVGRIVSLAREKQADEFVVGLPINMDGSRGPRAAKAEEFGKLLESVSMIPVTFADERCSTMLAHKILNVTDTRGKKRKNAVDTLSAEIILQSELDRRASSPPDRRH